MYQFSISRAIPIVLIALLIGYLCSKKWFLSPVPHNKDFVVEPADFVFSPLEAIEENGRYFFSYSRDLDFEARNKIQSVGFGSRLFVIRGQIRKELLSGLSDHALKVKTRVEFPSEFVEDGYTKYRIEVSNKTGNVHTSTERSVPIRH
jgi:hypothetical protein